MLAMTAFAAEEGEGREGERRLLLILLLDMDRRVFSSLPLSIWKRERERRPGVCSSECWVAEDKGEPGLPAVFRKGVLAELDSGGLPELGTVHRI